MRRQVPHGNHAFFQHPCTLNFVVHFKQKLAQSLCPTQQRAVQPLVVLLSNFSQSDDPQNLIDRGIQV
jgi:hypothetical protein